MDDVRRLVVQLAVAKAVQQQCAEVINTVKARLEVAMDPGDRKTAKVGNHAIGTVSYALSSASTEAKVTDSDALLMWVQENRPDWLDYDVTVDARDLDKALASPAPHSGELWLDLLEVARTRLAHPRVHEWALHVLLAGCRTGKAAVIPSTGEEVPGITVTHDPGGEGRYVAARISETQMGALSDAYQEGLIPDLLGLATMAPHELVGE